MDNHDYIGDTLQFRLMDKGIHLFKENVTLTQKCDRCDECDIVQSIVVYYGYSLINTCWSYQDFYIGHMYHFCLFVIV